MGKGGPLAFLNKKPWHPANYRNLEDVWKREQKKADDDKKLLELQKQHKEERDAEQLQEIAQQAGIVKKQERVDWMYQGQLFSQEAVKKEQDKVQQSANLKEEQQNQEYIEQQAAAQANINLPSFYKQQTSQAQNENWHRLHNDPLFMIMKRQQEGIQKITSNPVRMAQIREQLFNKENVSSIKNEEKHQSNKVKKQKLKKRQKNLRKKKKHRYKLKESEQVHHNLKQDSPSEESTPRLNSQSHSDQSHFDPQKLKSDQYNLQSSRHAIPKDKHRHYSDHKHSYKESNQKRHRDSDSNSEDNKQQVSNQIRYDGVNGDKSKHKKHRHDSDNTGKEVKKEALTEQDRYGLKESDIHKSQDRSQYQKENQERLKLAAQEYERRKLEEEQNRYQRKAYKTGKLSAEDRQKRIQEMTQNAQIHQDLKYNRVKAEPKKDTLKEDHYDKYKVAQDIYNLNKGQHASLEANLSRNKQQYKR